MNAKIGHLSAPRRWNVVCAQVVARKFKCLLDLRECQYRPEWFMQKARNVALDWTTRQNLLPALKRESECFGNAINSR